MYGRLVLFVSLLLCSIFSYGQELPPVISYTPEDYAADNQNWSVSQGDDRHIFVANNKGLLEFDGSDWRLYPTKNETIMRSVHAENDTVYTGCYRDFGFWVRDSVGMYRYSSLADGQAWQMDENEQVWEILSFSNRLLFQSLSALYIYSSGSDEIERIEVEGGITRIYVLGESLYLARPDYGIYTIERGELIEVSTADVFSDNLVVGMYDIDGDIYVQTNTKGIYSLEKDPKAWLSNWDERFGDMKVYSSAQSRSGDLYLGTVSRGIVVLSSSGEELFRMSRRNSLSNNTVLSVFEDADDNIWLGLDNGVNVIHRSAPLRMYYDDGGRLGTVYAAEIFRGNLYLGTNQGLFYRPVDDDNQSFQTVINSLGQVWSLFRYDNKLFCGHDNGAFLVDGNELRPLSESSGTWCFRPVPNSSGLLLAGDYGGLSIYEKNKDEWSFSHEIRNFNISSRFLEWVSDRSLLVDHEYKGVFRLGLDSSYRTAHSVVRDSTVDKGLYSSLATVNGNVYYAYEQGVFQYRGTSFQYDSVYSSIYDSSSYTSGKIVSLRNGNGAWMFSDVAMHLMRPDPLTGEVNIISLPITNNFRNAMLGYENVFEVSPDRYLFGHARGYFILDISSYLDRNHKLNIELRSAMALDFNQNSIFLDLDPDQPRIPNAYNTLYLEFSIPEFEPYFLTEYQYRIEGLREEWSDWHESNRVELNNLSYGDYVLSIRGRIGEEKTSQVIRYPFQIERPFYLSYLMIVVYVVLGLALLFAIHFVYKSYYKRQREALERRNKRKRDLEASEAKRKMMRLENEKLQEKIEGKNRELAVSTMSIIKKNRFLTKIKSELKDSSKRDDDVKKVVKIIDRNLKSSDDWKFFEEAFNNADKDFFKKVKEKHPKLTPNDLRLCAYLRLNLSSKEIAPLLSISPKSVEVKRYRLRKKMDLDSKVNLTDYVLSL
jgi:DNA-binding CsgD family transcriptional regulator